MYSANVVLQEEIINTIVKGGETSVKTRWFTVWNCCDSIIQLDHNKTNSEELDNSNYNFKDDKLLFKYNKELYERLMNIDNNDDSDDDFFYSEYENEFNEEDQLEINNKSEIIQDEIEIISEIDMSHEKQTPCVYLHAKLF
ncbi:hypothetical protein Glove_319g104 [Diversispora epigaea]|uniref:Uncharacterized protein n=1 Tax=Diversispora epigaea TaxID=1348612 RepID=A0A397HQ62_9GLOM|nr:hypothetical protein Glove_319g104 [Diversispora epigaea]